MITMLIYFLIIMLFICIEVKVIHILLILFKFILYFECCNICI